MKTISLNKYLILLTALTLPNYAAAQSPLSLGLGVKLLGGNWTGENVESGRDFEATDGGQLGFNAVLQKGRFYAGVNIQGGDYKFKDGAPDQISKQDSQFTVIQSDKETIKRAEADILVGYYFWSRVSMFLDIKVINSQWQDEDVDNDEDKYAVEFAGLGGGASTFIPLSENWTLFGSVGVVPRGRLKQKNGDQDEIGDGSSGALEFGGIFNFDRRNRLNFGVKFQHQTYEFDNGDKQEHQLNSVFLGYNHLFLFGSH